MFVRGIEAQYGVGIIWGTCAHLDKPPGHHFAQTEDVIWYGVMV
jgi:hypothetical protein